MGGSTKGKQSCTSGRPGLSREECMSVNSWRLIFKSVTPGMTIPHLVSGHNLGHNKVNTKESLKCRKVGHTPHIEIVHHLDSSIFHCYCFHAYCSPQLRMHSKPYMQNHHTLVNRKHRLPYHDSSVRPVLRCKKSLQLVKSCIRLMQSNFSNTTQGNFSTQNNVPTIQINPAIFLCIMLPLVVLYVVLKKKTRGTERYTFRHRIHDARVRFSCHRLGCYIEKMRYFLIFCQYITASHRYIQYATATDVLAPNIEVPISKT